MQCSRQQGERKRACSLDKNCLLFDRNKHQNVQAEAKYTNYRLASTAWVCPTACWLITQHLTKLGSVHLPKSHMKMGWACLEHTAGVTHKLRLVEYMASKQANSWPRHIPKAAADKNLVQNCSLLLECPLVFSPDFFFFFRCEVVLDVEVRSDLFWCFALDDISYSLAAQLSAVQHILHYTTVGRAKECKHRRAITRT